MRNRRSLFLPARAECKEIPHAAAEIGATEQTVASAEQAHQSAVVITTLSEGVAEVIKQYKL